MNKNTGGGFPTQVANKLSTVSVSSLIEKATAFLQSRGDYCEREVIYISGTWRQFNARGNCHHTNTIESRFKEALWNCGIPYRGRGYGPRVHDLRHTFAVRAMQKIRKIKGSNLIALPYLSVYLGHYNMDKTQQYLHLIADAYPELIEKEQEYLGDTIPTWEASE